MSDVDNVVDIADLRLVLDPTQNGTRPIPRDLLERLRQIRSTQQLLIEGCAAGLGCDLDRVNVDFNLDTGVISITPVIKE